MTADPYGQARSTPMDRRDIDRRGCGIRSMALGNVEGGWRLVPEELYGIGVTLDQS